ncbi:flagellar assembly peptidoglycan hydrolase FlgJ [Fulvimonas sp. R45]|uniref:flagellar assembly peptidoglycan hydrolase FlgJ n=1 Tax=Fulvimonas sp. R45 TaxID=3045937 RepID=UPI00265EFBB2|nr:flagellar assembly peptidoglycan hydrolase FlgJ [Fulvimonas sp. R45]MDO1528343.1 flagellar assembly peptidoglycan hydrolase FlgJ [Fulvimonas sp. R45]
MGVPGDVLQSVGTWTDLSGFDALRQSARADGKAALPVVARQFEAIFTQMMLKSMREAGMGDGLFDSEAGDAWRDLYDHQLALELSSHGRGFGIARMLERQLGGGASAAPASTTGDAPPAPPADGWRQRLDGVLDAARAAGNKVLPWLPRDAQDFVRELAPYARRAARQLGVSVRAVLAQAALETDWGRRMPRGTDGRSSNNLFGIKDGGGWDGDCASVPTVEYEDGIAVRRQARFRAYASPGESFADYARLLGGSPRYAQALGHGDDVRGFAQALVQGGYATDPDYAGKLAALADSPAMRQALAALKNAPPPPNS